MRRAGKSAPWRIEFTSSGRRSLRKLDPPVQLRILDALDVITILDNPRSRGKPLSGAYRDHWRYRFGQWRVIAFIDDMNREIVVTKVGARSGVY